MDFKIMKKIVFGLLMTMGVLNAQNNLVFNRVLEMYLTSSVSATVPQGKVWKVENANINILVTKPNVDYGLPMNETLFASHRLTWFSENTVIKSSTSNPLKISVLEFNVVPTSTGTGTGGGVVNSDGLVLDEIVSFKYTSTTNFNPGSPVTLIVPPGKIFKATSFTSYFRVGNTINILNNNSFMFGDYPVVNGQFANFFLEKYFTEGEYLIFLYDGGSSVNTIIVDGAFYLVP